MGSSTILLYLEKKTYLRLAVDIYTILYVIHSSFITFFRLKYICLNCDVTLHAFIYIFSSNFLNESWKVSTKLQLLTIGANSYIYGSKERRSK